MAGVQSNGNSNALVRRFGRMPEPEALPPYVGSAPDAQVPPEANFGGSDPDKAMSVRNDNYFISMTDAQFPPDEHTWIKDLERRPDTALKKSYHLSIPLQDVVKSAPTLKVGITFLSGADAATVALSEQNTMKTKDNVPHQQTAQWRVYTAATLLSKIEVGQDLRMKREDISERIVKNRKSLAAPPPTRSSSDSSKHSGKDQGRKDNVAEPGFEIARRQTTHHALTIDSEEVKLFHDIPTNKEDFDMTATLVEVDMLSMKALIENYNKIISTKGKQMPQADTVGVLDIMVGDVQRLCARSPRLFRMSTRSIIAESEDLRYGVDFGSLFTTVTTSEGIRHLIDSGSSFYKSLSEDKLDQSYIRPRFLQMLVLLLSMLNNTDLKLIGRFIESTYQVPGDRENLELLIMKVLPLQSINSEIFFKSLYAACKPGDPPKGSYQLREQGELWRNVQRDIARRGFIVPSISKESVPADSAAKDAQGLEDGWGSDSDEEEGPLTRGTWISDPPRGLEKLTNSSVFKYLQHDGKLRARGAEGSVRAINEIPHLETSSDDNDSRITLLFRNGDQFRVWPEHAELIQTMTPNIYPLEPVQSGFLSADLEISEELLNGHFIEATNQLNALLKTIRDVLGRRIPQTRSFRDMFGIGGQGSGGPLADIDAPTEATRVTATIKKPGMDGLTQEKVTVAVAFKMANRVVFLHYILKAMTDNSNKLKHAVKWVDTQKAKLQGMKARDDQEFEYFRSTIKACDKELAKINELRQMANKDYERVKLMPAFGETDPIQRIQLSAFDQVHAELPEWQDYESALVRDSDVMRMKARKFVVGAVVPDVKEPNLRVTFRQVALELLIEPLSFGGVHDKDLVIARDSLVGWVGHYLVVLKELEKEKYKEDYAHAVQGYFRVLTQTYTGNGSKTNVLRTMKLSRIAIM